MTLYSHHILGPNFQGYSCFILVRSTLNKLNIELLSQNSYYFRQSTLFIICNFRNYVLDYIYKFFGIKRVIFKHHRCHVINCSLSVLLEFYSIDSPSRKKGRLKKHLIGKR